MALIDIKINPSRKDLRIFAVLWALFFVVLDRMVHWKPEALLMAAAVTGVAFLISISFNRDQPKSMQTLGIIIPLVLLLIGGLEKFAGVDPKYVGWTVITVGVLGGIAIFVSAAIGKFLYTNWMYAALPLGWTFSHLILGLVFFLVVSPIGFILRATGRDPLERAFDRSAASYWKPHQQVADPSRYFRQY